MILIKDLYSVFNVHKIKYEPKGFSEWELSFKNGDKFWALEPSSLTNQRDSTLEKITAQILILDDLISIPQNHEKKYRNNLGALEVTGVYKSDYLPGDDNYNAIIVDSVFPIKVDRDPINNPLPVNKGEWITIEGLPYIDLPRGHNLRNM